MSLIKSQKSQNDDESSLFCNMMTMRKDGVLSVSDQKILRTSNLKAPIMLLTGHQAEVFSIKFHPNGNNIASAGKEGLIYLWNVYGNCDNYVNLKGHKGTITELSISSNGVYLASSCVDKTIGFWDFQTGEKLRSFRGHSSFVNSCSCFSRGSNLVASGSDDGSLRIWDDRVRNSVLTLDGRFPILTCCFDSFGNQVLSGGIDNTIKIWDIRSKSVAINLIGHTDSITGISLSPDGSYALSNSMDQTIRMWDIYPYTDNNERCLKMFRGHLHNFEQNLLRCDFSCDSKFVISGSSDGCVYIWDSVSAQLIYKLPGHTGSVNDVAFHPNEPIVASCSSDAKVYLGEIRD